MVCTQYNQIIVLLSWVQQVYVRVLSVLQMPHCHSQEYVIVMQQLCQLQLVTLQASHQLFDLLVYLMHLLVLSGSVCVRVTRVFDDEI